MSKRSSSRPNHPQSNSSKSIEQGRRSNGNYLEFYVPSDTYNIVFVNDQTDSNEMNMLLRHVRFCRQYSIDTESDQRNHRLSLIQVNSMSIRDKSLVILIELEQLPYQDQIKYEKIRELFRLLFREDNELFSWGNVQEELEPRKELFTWPISAVFVDLQLYFPGWYSWGRSQCRGMTLSHRGEVNDEEDERLQQYQRMLACSCHLQSPYNPGELWSLKNAFKYGCNLFIDKSARLANWSSSLTSRHSSLSYQEQKKMIRYATYDVLAVSFLARPIAERWTFEDVQNRLMEEAICGFNSVKLPQLPTPKPKKTKIKNLNLGTLSKIISQFDSDLDSISSDDEIHLDQINVQIPRDYQQEHQDKLDVVNDDRLLTQENAFDVEVKKNNDDDNVRTMVDNHEVVVDEVKPPAEQRQRGNRSKAAKKKRNKRRNLQQRQHRYQYATTRKYYYRMKSRVARRILRYYDVDFKHIKKNEENGTITIGCRNQQVLDDCQQRLSHNCFDQHQYKRFSR